MRFRAVWPIVDDTVPVPDLCREATATLPSLTARAGARLTGHGRFLVAPSDLVPGSGRVTAWTLVYDAPAARVTRRAFAATSTRLRTYDSNDHHACPRCGVVRDSRPRSLCMDCESLARLEADTAA